MSNITGYDISSLTNATLVGGKYQITTADDKTYSLTFSQLLLAMGLNSLTITRGTFNTQFAIAQERVDAMRQLNDLVQAMNLYKNDFTSEGKVTDPIQKRNDDLLKNLLSGLQTTVKDGKTYAICTDGKQIGPLEFFQHWDAGGKTTKTTSFNELIGNQNAFNLMIQQAKFALFSQDNAKLNRYMALHAQVKQYHNWSGDGHEEKYMAPKNEKLSPPLTGDDLAFMQEICPILRSAYDNNFGIVDWSTEDNSRNYWVGSQLVKDGKTYTGLCLIATVSPEQLAMYKAMLETPLQPSGYTLQQMQEITSEVAADKNKTSFMSGADLQKLEAFMKKYPGTLNANVNDIKVFTQKELETFLSNCQTAQSTLSSLNEQQGMRTNQAMQRSSGMLQTLQTLLQTANQTMQSAAGTGG